MLSETPGNVTMQRKVSERREVSDDANVHVQIRRKRARPDQTNIRG